MYNSNAYIRKEIKREGDTEKTQIKQKEENNRDMSRI